MSSKEVRAFVFVIALSALMGILFARAFLFVPETYCRAHDNHRDFVQPNGIILHERTQ